jgi:hypothetical protein
MELKPWPPIEMKLQLYYKVKYSRHTPQRRLGKRSYSSYSFTTSVIYGDEWSASRPGRALAPWKGPPVTNVQEDGWAPEPVWTERLGKKFFHLCREPNLDRLVNQSVVRHYTDWATPAPWNSIMSVKCSRTPHMCWRPADIPGLGMIENRLYLTANVKGRFSSMYFEEVLTLL